MCENIWFHPGISFTVARYFSPSINYLQYPWGYSVPVKKIISTREAFHQYPWQYAVWKMNEVSLMPRGNSTLIRRVCATSVLNLPPCSGVGNPQKNTLFWSYHSFLKCDVLCCVGTKIMFMLLLYLFNQWFYHSTLVLPCLCKRVVNFLLLLSV